MNRIDEIKEVRESVMRIKLMSGMSGVIDLIDELMSEAERLTAERDAAVRDMEKALADTDACNLCKHYEPNGKDSDCKIMHYDDYGMDLHGKCIFEWRGPCAENANPSGIPTP